MYNTNRANYKNENKKKKKKEKGEREREMRIEECHKVELYRDRRLFSYDIILSPEMYCLVDGLL